MKKQSLKLYNQDKIYKTFRQTIKIIDTEQTGIKSTDEK